MPRGPYTHPGLVFLVLALPFYLNDFAFILLNGTEGVYLADYLTRCLVLAIIFFWAPARAIATENLRTGRPVALFVLAAALLPLFGRFIYNFVEAPFVAATGLEGLFEFGALQSPLFYWLDLTVGLLLVAITEELVFRKFALKWLEARNVRPLLIVLISALVFALMHWGSGPGRLLYTLISGAAYMAVYLRIRTLWPLIAAHWVEDFFAFGPFDLF